MNLIRNNSKGCLIAESDEPSFDPPPATRTSALMVGSDIATHNSEQTDRVLTPPHYDVRQLVRLVQCLQCSKPFTAPVTLPCGHTVCRECLPSAEHRANISWPNTEDRQRGYTCPFPDCGTVHPTGECSVDVTLTKLIDKIRVEGSKATQLAGNHFMLLEEVPPRTQTTPIENRVFQYVGRTRELPGGRLVATFTMAEMGELGHASEVLYTSTSMTVEEEQVLDTNVRSCIQEAALKELDCLVCYNLMLDPTTTSCGHTFCRRCLARVLDHGNDCPICRRKLHIPPSLQDQPSNARLVAILNGLCPDLVAARVNALNLEEQSAESNLSTPIFICTLALPSMPTFLHIFEPRYRLMMRRCLEGNRQFGMVMYNQANHPQGDLGTTPFLEYGTLLEIVNFELLRDGRSFIETRGVGRFRIREHGMLDGYNIARVERVEDVSLTEEERMEAEETKDAQASAEGFQRQHPNTPLDPNLALNLKSTHELLTRCTSFVERMRSHSASWLSTRIVSVYGGPPNDPALFPYWFAAVLPIAEEEKYILLRTTSVRERLKLVDNWIRRIEGQPW
ncbi:hypothetical protein EJ04DRAFT_73233 [Polyplosphaeria fusca]|uniref:Uncharacterized protein n=1 Tax=Polyplosphaeria fusca TaxID=682080 RepID=A0A9P4V668_9PLEO|nr:hypothetical protein EJ04DRAFT_73233 [Polyplosphaeria fusca]